MPLFVVLFTLLTILVLRSLLLCRTVTSRSLLWLLLLSEVGGEDVDRVDVGVEHVVDVDVVVVLVASGQEKGVASSVGRIIPEVS
jgi:hypothetical protein